MSLVLQSSGGGSVTLQEPSTNTNLTASLPAATGTVMVSGNMPAFSASLIATNQSVSSGVSTKLQFSVEEFDTNNNYDTSLYRFTPTVAGYYQINLSAYISGTSLTQQNLIIYKNGSAYKGAVYPAVSGGTVLGSALSSVVYCNGSTDYIEAYTLSFGTSPIANGGVYLTYFNGSMIRAA